MMSKIAPCLWFDGQAEQAANFYVSLLPNSRVDAVNKSPADYPSGKKGDVLTVEFTLAGSKYIGLNGGPLFKFNEAVSFQIYCENQAEGDRLTDALSAVPEAEQCGWVKDKYGLSWQIVPIRLLAFVDRFLSWQGGARDDRDAEHEADQHRGDRASRGGLARLDATEF